ncbi:MAG TPA: HEAT repeat domain-containing protein [Nitrospirales bacterium]|jgi:HEAT repeat protein|nr:HEAT repeat domain-containing protein [Nitrospirales bacterium]
MKRFHLLLAFAMGVALALAPVSVSFALTEEETKRAEALIPLLDGPQEFWAIGEFVHLGPPAVPVLGKALQHPNRRVRVNALETMSLIKDKSAMPFLNAQASNAQEVPAVREKALRVAVRLDPTNALPALQAMAKDPSDTIRNAVVHESRYVKDKAVIDLLITLLADDSTGVADGAYRTLYGFTGRHVDRQDFVQSTKEQRMAWSREWAQWWGANRDKFQFAPEKSGF